MLSSALYLLLIPVVISSPVDNPDMTGGHQLCSKSELDHALNATAACAEAAQMRNDTDFCVRTHESVDGCTDQHLRKCYNDTQIRDYKDLVLHIIVGVMQSTNQSSALDSCDITKTFIQRGADTYKATATCDQQQVMAASDEVSKCIDGKQKTFQDQIKAQNPTEHEKIFCDFMEGAIVQCPEIARHCYDDEGMKVYKKIIYDITEKVLEGLKEVMGGLQLSMCSTRPGLEGMQNMTIH